MSWGCLCASASSHVVSERVCVGWSDSSLHFWRLSPGVSMNTYTHVRTHACTHTCMHAYTLVTSDLNLEPEVAWGKVMSWMETDRLIRLETGHWPLLMRHTKSSVSVCPAFHHLLHHHHNRRTRSSFIELSFFYLVPKVINIVTFWLLFFFFLVYILISALIFSIHTLL